MGLIYHRSSGENSNFEASYFRSSGKISGKWVLQSDTIVAFYVSIAL